MNSTTKILRQTADTFIAETENGAIRVGILDTAHTDYPASFGVDVAGLLALTGAEFDDIAEDLAAHCYAESGFVAGP